MLSQLMAGGPVFASSRTLGYLSVKGSLIVSPSEQPVLLRGVNYRGYCSAAWNEHTEGDYRLFAASGFNVVRLPLAWSTFEPKPGVFDRYVLKYIDRDVQWAKRYGLYIVLDMHQWYWARKFFRGCGAPDWAVTQYPATEAGYRDAFANFWINRTLQDDFIKVWITIAKAYANEATIAGYDIFNEPQVFTSTIPYLNASYVESFYLKAIAAIRNVDPKHIVFLEPANMYIDVTRFPVTENIVWSPHFYPLAFAAKYTHANMTILQADMAAKYNKWAKSGSPVWFGEFGAFMEDGSNTWLQDARTLFDQYQVGWAWWVFNGKTSQQIPSSLAMTPSG
jgi:hypothetical protein